MITATAKGMTTMAIFAIGELVDQSCLIARTDIDYSSSGPMICRARRSLIHRILNIVLMVSIMFWCNLHLHCLVLYGLCEYALSGVGY
jgi:hypothetical protein